ncbi:FMN-dependent alpha-hydroxy acid dehydrogenase [Lentinus tigrinus ALCF2SS1-7]|uniref:FMN-dependent alpha-hydroxy acid dehydrogenase n=1 Tax=Lentinus tigrinus ALCF2SS1-6 TaxID=1328759 RepID=A0A5C2RZY1_9APHY|nr:FMN-dependent alpha-hydroxy acid dehydrogenase [Lentinus tigrinus ALCF2SS1-6]RPD71679.1 FMN-dependent alpha-hydroxy acid dehydrogenase [Lentinus tigrinus ALCF2SS1-7]
MSTSPNVSGETEKSYGSAPGKWSAYMRDLFRTRQPPPLGSVDPDKIEAAAREKLKDSPGSFNFVFGYAGTGETYRANRRAFTKWQIVPRMLRDATHRNLETTIFGVTHPSPLIIAPIGCQALVHADGELATARAANALGIPMILSGAASQSLESVAQANANGTRWFQLYWPLNNDITLSMLGRAKSQGYKALVVTVDTMAIGWRPHDIDSSFLPFIHSVGIQVALSDPAFMKTLGLEPHTEKDFPAFPYNPKEYDRLVKEGDEKTKQLMHLAMAWGKEAVNGVFRTWEDVRFLRQHWEGPLIVKGIMTAEDAETAIDEGVDGIIVSNHGGRQIDGSISALFALERIMQSSKVKEAQASGKFTILFDSGVRSGSDMFRAIALGAQGVLLGRSYIYGLALAGQAGVESVIKTILADFELTLGLAGHKTIADIHGKAGEVTIKVTD